MSRRRNAGDPRRANRSNPAASAAGAPPPSPERAAGGPSFLLQVAVVIGAFVGATLLAELFGADSLGVAIGIGQITFAIALVAVLLRGS